MTTLNNFRVDFSATLKVEFSNIKIQLTKNNRTILYKGLNTLKVVDLTQLDASTCAEDVEFRKALFPKLRFWMRDIIVAGKSGELTKQEVINICTFVRAAAVERISILRSLYPQTEAVIEVVECDETGRPITEVQAEYIAELEAEVEKAATIITDATKHISNLKDKNKRLTAKNKQLQTQLNNIKLATKAYNKVIAK